MARRIAAMNVASTPSGFKTPSGETGSKMAKTAKYIMQNQASAPATSGMVMGTNGASNLSSTTIQAAVSGTSSVSATIAIYGSNWNAASGGVLLDTLSLSGTTVATGGFVVDDWPYCYAVLTAISGTGAFVDISAGY